MKRNRISIHAEESEYIKPTVMKECEKIDCTRDGKYYEHLKLTLCQHHKQEYEEELYWEKFYKENGIGAYAGHKTK